MYDQVEGNKTPLVAESDIDMDSGFLLLDVIKCYCFFYGDKMVIIGSLATKIK